MTKSVEEQELANTLAYELLNKQAQNIQLFQTTSETTNSESDYKTTFSNLAGLSNERLYIEFCEAAYSPSCIFTEGDWKCIAFLDHNSYFVNGVETETDLYEEINSFAGGAYYNCNTNELVFSYRGSERDFDDWVTNDFFGFGADDIPSQFDNTYKFFTSVISSLNDENSPFFDSQGNKININGVDKITFTGNSLGGGLAQLMSM